MEILKFILEDGLIMIPCLYVIVEVIKATKIVNDRYLPLIAILVSIGLTPLILSGRYNADNIVQAILIAGATVLTDQAFKQMKEE